MDVQVHDTSAYRDWLGRGGLGFSESWLAGKWDSDSVETCVEIAFRSLDRAGWVRRAYFAFSRSHDTAAGARLDATSGELVREHYDMPVGVFASMLGPRLLYSCCRWSLVRGDLAEAESSAIESIFASLPAGFEERGLKAVDLGCGWGAISVEASRRGWKIDALTVSRTQQAYIRGSLGDGDAIAPRVHCASFDTIEPRSDSDVVFCIEMAESVTPYAYPRLASWIFDSLRPGGVAVVQYSGVATRIGHSLGRRPSAVTDLVFTGSTLVAHDQFAEAMLGTGLSVISEERMAPDYLLTLTAWRANLRANYATVDGAGGSSRELEHFLSCAIGFFRSSHGDCWRTVYRKANATGDGSRGAANALR